MSAENCCQKAKARESAARKNKARKNTGGKSKNRRGRLKRRAADRHLLYQWSVQVPDFEIDFMDRTFRKRRGRRPLSLREDFCGTALLSSEWVNSRSDRSAIGVDLDHETLAWGSEHNLSRLDGAAARISLLEQDVRIVTRPKVDVVCAYNFSYFLLHPLSELIAYFKRVRRSLKKDGMVFLDAYGGWESQQQVKETRKVDGPEGTFDYTWEQASFNPVDNLATCYIHFGFAGGKRLRKAFRYDWRLYSPAEVRDALAAAGFANSYVYWDRSTSEDHDDYRCTRRAQNTPGWLAYIVGEK